GGHRPALYAGAGDRALSERGRTARARPGFAGECVGAPGDRRGGAGARAAGAHLAAPNGRAAHGHGAVGPRSRPPRRSGPHPPAPPPFRRGGTRDYTAAATGAGPASTSCLVTGSTRNLSPSSVREPSHPSTPVRPK